MGNDNENVLSLDDAVNALDHGIDGHWTKGGLPDVEALQAMTGNKAITRKMIGEIAPDLVRVAPQDDAEAEITALEIVDAVDGDAVLLAEAFWQASNAPRYQRNSFVKNMALGYANVAVPMKDLQGRLDNQTTIREERRAKREEQREADGVTGDE